MAQSVSELYQLQRSTPASPEDARLFCRQLATQHYENFTIVSWYLPRRLRQHFYNVYAYCRVSDDLADEEPDQAASLELLADWREQLHAMYDGQASHPVFVALQETIAAFDIPQEPFDLLLDAFVQDRHQTRYATFEELLEFCRRSADRLAAWCSTSAAIAMDAATLSDCTCTALQLAKSGKTCAATGNERGAGLPPREDRTASA